MGSCSHFNFSFCQTSTRVSITVWKHGKCFRFLKCGCLKIKFLRQIAGIKSFLFVVVIGEDLNSRGRFWRDHSLIKRAEEMRMESCDELNRIRNRWNGENVLFILNIQPSPKGRFNFVLEIAIRTSPRYFTGKKAPLQLWNNQFSPTPSGETRKQNGKEKQWRFYVSTRCFGRSLKAMSHGAIFLATCNAMALHCKLQGRLPRVTTSLATKNCVASCRESRSSFYFSQWMLRDELQRVKPPLQLVSQFFEKDAADIFKYSAGVKYNLIAGRKTSCVRLTS